MSFLERFGRFGVRWWWAILLVATVSFAPAIYFAKQLTVKENLTDLLPEGDPAVEDLMVVLDKIGGTAFTIVAVGYKDDPKLAERFADTLQMELPKLTEAVEFAEARLDVDFVKDRRLLYLPEKDLRELVDEAETWIDKRVLGEAGLFVDLEADDSDSPDDLKKRFEGRDAKIPLDAYQIGKDKKYLYVFVRMRGNTGDLEYGKRAFAQIMDRVESLKDGTTFPKTLETRYSGSVLIRVADSKAMGKDLSVASVISFGSVIFLLGVLTLRPELLFTVAYILLLGVAWTFAFARLSIGYLNIITGFLATILFGLGIDFGIHMFLRVLEEQRHGKNFNDAVARTMESSGRSIVSSAVTTAAAFLVIIGAGFRGYSEFGLLAGGGIVVMMVFSLLLFPALVTAFNKVVRIAPRRTDLVLDIGLHFFKKPIVWTFSILMPLLIAYSAYAVYTGEVKIRTNWREIKGESPESEFDDYIVDSLGRSFTQTIVFVPNPDDAGLVRDTIVAVRDQRRAQGQPTGIKEVISTQNLVPKDQQAKLPILAGLKKQLDRVKPDQLKGDDLKLYNDVTTLAGAQPFALGDLPPSLTQRFKTRPDASGNPGTLVLISSDYLFYESTELMAWADEMDEVQAALRARNVGARLMSENWVAGRMFRMMTEDGPFLLWSSLGAVFLVILFDYRKLSHSLIVMAPIALGLFSIAGAMALLNVQLNFINSIMLPAVVGISVDNAIHNFRRYLEEPVETLEAALDHLTGANLLATGTTVLGFGSMMVAHHKGIYSLGLLSVIGISSSYVFSSILFPAVLVWWAKRKAAAGSGAAGG